MLDQHAASVYAEHSCGVNVISADVLFSKYFELGFLYPEKMERLAEHMDEIKQTWVQALKDPAILSVVTFGEVDSDRWASVAAYRTHGRSWNHQHLVAKGSAAYKVFSTVALARAQDDDLSQQMWFRPTNRFPQRFFGETLKRSAPAYADVAPFSYAVLSDRNAGVVPTRHRVREMLLDDKDKLENLVGSAVNNIYAAGEEYSDFKEVHTNRVFSASGLTRARHGFCIEEADKLLAAAVVNDGPLGLNFSFLENRVDLFVDPGLLTELARECVASLLQTVAGGGFPSIGWRPLLVPMRDTELLPSNVNVIRTYNRGTLLHGGYSPWVAALTVKASSGSIDET